jgi:hypothetical protein
MLGNNYSRLYLPVDIVTAVAIQSKVAEAASQGFDNFEFIEEHYILAGFDPQQVRETVDAVDINL